MGTPALPKTTMANMFNPLGTCQALFYKCMVQYGSHWSHVDTEHVKRANLNRDMPVSIKYTGFWRLTTIKNVKTSTDFLILTAHENTLDIKLNHVIKAHPFSFLLFKGSYYKTSCSTLMLPWDGTAFPCINLCLLRALL